MQQHVTGTYKTQQGGPCALLARFRPSPSTSASCPVPESAAWAAKKAGRHLTCLLGVQGPLPRTGSSRG